MYNQYDSESGFMCMEVSGKSDSIMSLRLGRLSRNPEEACNQHLFFDKSIQPVIIVSAKHGQRNRCPLVGKYSTIHPCKKEISFGCANAGATQFNFVQDKCGQEESELAQSKSKSIFF